MNERIRAREVRLIDENGAQLGIMATQQALQMARQRDFDLIEVAPNAQPPVCRIMDFGKHKYQTQKREREAHRRAHTSEVRLIRLKPQIDQHDLEIKVKKLREMLGEGDKVRIQLRFRGREMSRPQMGVALLNGVAERVGDIATVEGQARLEGRLMNMLFAPKPGARAAAPKKDKPSPPKREEAEKKEPAPPAPAAGAPSLVAAAPASPEPVREESHGKQAEDTEDGGEAG